MKYALIGDIHSSKEDLEKVLKQIKRVSPEAKVIGTGDLFECTVSKKNMPEEKFYSLDDVMVNGQGFVELLTFPTVYGNQEERILHLTKPFDRLREWMEKLPETIEIDGAEVIHGHQWQWGGLPWTLLRAETTVRLTFFGHSHMSMLSIDRAWQKISWNIPYDVSAGEVLVNVGAVVGACEWVLYDARKQVVTFKKA